MSIGVGIGGVVLFVVRLDTGCSILQLALLTFVLCLQCE